MTVQDRLENTLADLISFESITPHDQNCQSFLKDRLASIGFKHHDLPHDSIDNFWASYGDTGPTLAFAGHTDVVTPGRNWEKNPFHLTKKSGRFFGRGVADMKGGLAAFLIACEDFINEKPNFNGKLAWIITSAEESDLCQYGTPIVMDWLKQQKLIPDYCIVGEPSSHKETGDLIRIGRRGSLSAKLTIYGKQGHVAYPHLAENPIHLMTPFLSELNKIEWDQGDPDFPKTTLQITHITAGEPAASNVIPGDVTLHFNLRFSPASTELDITNKINTLLEKYFLNHKIEWRLSGNPFITRGGHLLNTVVQSIKTITDLDTTCSTGGGTSDGRYIAPYDVEVIELGLCNDSIHQVNENIVIEDLYTLYKIYLTILQRIF